LLKTYSGGINYYYLLFKEEENSYYVVFPEARIRHDGTIYIVYDVIAHANSLEKVLFPSMPVQPKIELL
jgi:hypothetical protein